MTTFNFNRLANRTRTSTSTQVDAGPVGNGPGMLGWGAVGLAMMLMLLDYVTGFNGLRIEVLLRNITFGIIGGGDIAANPLIRMVWGIQFWSIMIVWAVFRKYSPDIPFIKSFPRVGAAVLAVLFIGFSGGFYSAAGFAHMLMAFAFNFLVLEKVMNFRQAREIAIYYLLFDFIGYGLLDYFAELSPVLQLFSNRIVVPLWLYGSFYFMSDYEKKAGTGLWLLLMFNLFMVANAIIFPILATNAVQFDTAQQRLEAMEGVGTAYDNVKALFFTSIGSIRGGVTAGIDEASGGYYRSKNPPNEDPNNRLGVYIENLAAQRPQFNAEQAPLFWGDLFGRKLELGDNKREVRVSMECSGINDKGGIAHGTISPSNIARKLGDGGVSVEQVGKVLKEKEQIYFECGFDAGRGSDGLKSGSSTVKVSAAFNFETISTLTTHLMDEEFIRASRSEGKDPLIIAGISERRPVAIPSSGPVKLGIGTNVDPVSLNLVPGEKTKTFAGFTVERYWPGEISKIHSLEITLPGGFIMDERNGELCGGEFLFVRTTNEEFGLGRNIYKLVEGDKNRGTDAIKTPIINHVSWRCPISISAEDATAQLGTGRSVTRQIEADVRYDFRVEKQILTYVKIDASVPKEELAETEKVDKETTT